MIKILNGEITEINRREALRYAGCFNSETDVSDAVYSECENIILASASPKACYDVFPIKREGDTLDLGFCKIISKDLLKNLEGCSRAAVFAATIGTEIDRNIIKYSKLSPARAIFLQGIGSAAIENWCDSVNAKITEEYGRTRPRFSCGYGDLQLCMQCYIFTALDVTKNIGITLTENNFMIPTKSVTAIVGILEK